MLRDGGAQEEENLKAVVDADGELDAGQPYLAREQGVNRYDTIIDFDFSARDAYWRATAAFWADVRAEWARVYAERESFRISTPPGEPPLFAPMFDYAAELESGRSYDPEAGREFIRTTLERYLN